MLQDAVREGYLCDLKITALVLMGNLQQRLETLVQVLSERDDWAPMLVIFNKAPELCSCLEGADSWETVQFINRLRILIL